MDESRMEKIKKKKSMPADLNIEVRKAVDSVKKRAKRQEKY